jgi:hypothetical protein
MTAVVGMPTALGGLGLSTNVIRSAESLPEIFRKAYRVILDGNDTLYHVRGALLGMWKPQARRNVRIDVFSAGILHQILEQFELMDYKSVREQVDPEGRLSGARIRSLAKKQDIYGIDDLTALVEKPYIVRKLLMGQQDDKSLRVVPIKHRLSQCWTILESLEEVQAAEPIPLELIEAARKKAAEPTFLDLKEVTTCAVDNCGGAIDPESDDVDWEKVTFIDRTLKELLLEGSPSLTLLV